MDHRAQPSVIVIGAGFGGLGMAHHLRQAGFDDITILERSDDVGGVWRDNVYPGAACDVPSALYSWSFAPKHDWSHRYARQPEILAYIRDEAARQGLLDLVRTGAEVTSASWDDAERRWTLVLTTGEELVADVVVSAVGQLSRPSVPAIPGLDTFEGTTFHSATWDHSVSLRGRRVGVVGTGASAIQFVPAIVDEVGSMTVFQRSAPYVVPKGDRTYTEWQKRLFRGRPRIHDLARRSVFVLSEQLNRTLDSDGAMTTLLHQAWRLHLRHQVKDPALRAKLVPDFPIGCKRLLFSNDWYPALTREHVDVVSDRITAVDPAGVITADGTHHDLDVLILGTGFAATEFLAPMEIRGREGKSLHDAWQGGARAHLGITVPGFPNFFMLYGPNTNLGGSSIIGMLEAQAGYVVQAAREIRSAQAALEVREEAFAAYDEEIQSRLAHSVWSRCASWYREPSGRITTNWPGTVTEYQGRTGQFDPAAFRTIGPVLDPSR